MPVTKRKWKTAKGEAREAYIIRYTDGAGKRHIETFERKKDAELRYAIVKVDVSKGVHTPASANITVAIAAADWIRFIKLEGRERSTVEQYRQHAELHIIPRIGNEKIAKLSTPRLNMFRDDLLRDMSRSLAKKILVSLKAILRDAKRRGNIAQNVASDVSITMDKRGNGKLAIPTPDEIKRILDAATGRTRPFIVTATFTGLRASELRGLRWADVDFSAGKVHVRQRADRYNAIGRPKSQSSERTIPIGPFVQNTLKTWKLACPKGELDLVFPNGAGNIEALTNIITRMLGPVQIAAGVIDSKGKPKYPGVHALRHFFASWCINRKVDGGRELPMKNVQELLGHSSIVMTSDVYGHLFPSGDDSAELAAAESRFG